MPKLTAAKTNPLLLVVLILQFFFILVNILSFQFGVYNFGAIISIKGKLLLNAAETTTITNEQVKRSAHMCYYLREIVSYICIIILKGLVKLH